MRLSRHILLRRLLAFLFLFILLYAQGVKALHRHPGTAGAGIPPVEKNALAGKIITTAHTCDICNYQLTRDILLPAYGLYTAALHGYQLPHVPHEHKPDAGTRLLQGNKGPPLFAAPAVSSAS